MGKWEQSINIKQHLGEDDDLGAIIKAAKGVRSELLKLNVKADDYEFEELSDWFDDVSTLNPETTTEDPDDLLEEFNYRLSELYDWADYNRVWLGL